MSNQCGEPFVSAIVLTPEVQAALDANPFLDQQTYACRRPHGHTGSHLSWSDEGDLFVKVWDAEQEYQIREGGYTSCRVPVDLDGC